MTRSKSWIVPPFIVRMEAMLKSPAFAALSLAGHRLLNRLEIEHLQHGGQENGNLIVTYDQFCESGIDRHGIKPAIRETVALGFVEVTQQGRGGNAEYRTHSKYRLTYLPTDHSQRPRHNWVAPTHEWQKIVTREQAKAVATSARQTVEKAKSRWGEKPVSVGKTITENV